MRCANALTLAVLLAATVGCAMCANPYDAYYAAYGGRRARLDMANGRVASFFDPAHALEAAPPVMSESLPEVPEPATEEELPPKRDEELPADLEKFLPDQNDLPPVPQSDDEI